jgi:hypothetical protein
MQVLEYKGQNEFGPLYESKVLTYSDERDMSARRGRDGTGVHPSVQMTTMLSTEYSVPQVSDKSM